MYRKEYLEDQICLMLGGRAAEIGDPRHDDRGRAPTTSSARPSLARKMVAELGMSDLGPICLKDSAELPRSQELLDRVEETTRAILDAQLQRALDDRRSPQGRDRHAGGWLLERDTLDRAEIEACFPSDARPN